MIVGGASLRRPLAPHPVFRDRELQVALPGEAFRQDVLDEDVLVVEEKHCVGGWCVEAPIVPRLSSFLGSGSWLTTGGGGTGGA